MEYSTTDLFLKLQKLGNETAIVDGNLMKDISKLRNNLIDTNLEIQKNTELIKSLKEELRLQDKFVDNLAEKLNHLTFKEEKQPTWLEKLSQYISRK